MDNIEEMKAKIESLEKENTKLNRTIKLLRKKVSRMRSREEALTSEIEEMDMLAAVDIQVSESFKREELMGGNRCPKCGQQIEIIDAGLVHLGICNGCGYRKAVKK